MRYLLLALLFISCTAKKYRIETLVKQYSLITNNYELDTKYDSVETENDTVAYKKAADDFLIYKKVGIQMSNSAKGRPYIIPLSFHVYNEKGEDIKSKLPTAFLANVEGYLERNGDRPLDETKSSTGAQVVSYSQPGIDSQEIKRLKRETVTKVDEFNAITWIKPKSAPSYRSSNGMYCYFATEEGKPTNFRLVIQYYADDWLFIKNYKFLIDGKPFSFTPEDIKTDNGSGYIWEWCDEHISSYNQPLIEALANAKTVKLRLEGSKYYDERNISASQLKSIKNIYRLYQGMGGSFY